MKHITTGLAAAIFTLVVTAALADPAMVADSSKGKILVDAKGMALYTYDKDTPGVSTGNLTAWPALAATATDMPSGDWTIIDRTDGTKIWAYKGKAIYHYVKDTNPGDVTGDGVGGAWHLITQ